MFLKFFNKKATKDAPDIAGGAGRLVDGIDLEMNYCPSCGEEFRQEVENCPACTVTLVTGSARLAEIQETQRPVEGRSMVIGPDEPLVFIRKGPLKDIKEMRKVLARERIPAIIAGDEASCTKGCCGPEMYLQIKESDVEAATLILAKEHIATTALDPADLLQATAVFDHQAPETTCPACGCCFAPTIGACPECGLSFE